MRLRVIKIGNSQGIRIPKALLDQIGIMDDVEFEVGKNKITIRPVANPRTGWEDSFRTMAQNGDDTLLYGNEHLTHSWDKEEWQW